ncbi:myb-related transcription factor [Stylonychia lemnae]|uniref:Myb-related transcription factor n=1 Tax=Stylonychia lemnae TaxID=5949 RepID=A0A078AE33_STYLE|nr:myb-related transcription factor [Stylonychia lemnae]|eukprot:CDW80101.1 myb-related transcription factor [Stylonychia lemnae]
MPDNKESNNISQVSGLNIEDFFYNNPSSQSKAGYEQYSMLKVNQRLTSNMLETFRQKTQESQHMLSRNQFKYQSKTIEFKVEPEYLMNNFRTHCDESGMIRQQLKRINTGRWTKQEHEQFLDALRKYGKNWNKIFDSLETRSEQQVRSHAQKFFIKMKSKKNIKHLDIYEALVSYNSRQIIQQQKSRNVEKIQAKTCQNSNSKHFDFNLGKVIHLLLIIEYLQKDQQEIFLVVRDLSCKKEPKMPQNDQSTTIQAVPNHECLKSSQSLSNINLNKTRNRKISESTNNSTQNINKRLFQVVRQEQKVVNANTPKNDIGQKLLIDQNSSQKKLQLAEDEFKEFLEWRRMKSHQYDDEELVQDNDSRIEYNIQKYLRTENQKVNKRKDISPSQLLIEIDEQSLYDEMESNSKNQSENQFYHKNLKRVLTFESSGHSPDVISLKSESAFQEDNYELSQYINYGQMNDYDFNENSKKYNENQSTMILKNGFNNRTQFQYTQQHQQQDHEILWQNIDEIQII